MFVVVCCCSAVAVVQVSGSENAEFVKFSGSALGAAQQRLASFLAVMPAGELATAKEQLAAESAYDEAE